MLLKTESLSFSSDCRNQPWNMLNRNSLRSSAAFYHGPESEISEKDENCTV